MRKGAIGSGPAAQDANAGPIITLRLRIMIAFAARPRLQRQSIDCASAHANNLQRMLAHQGRAFPLWPSHMAPACDLTCDHLYDRPTGPRAVAATIASPASLSFTLCSALALVVVLGEGEGDCPSPVHPVHPVHPEPALVVCATSASPIRGFRLQTSPMSRGSGSVPLARLTRTWLCSFDAPATSTLTSHARNLFFHTLLARTLDPVDSHASGA